MENDTPNKWNAHSKFIANLTPTFSNPSKKWTTSIYLGVPVPIFGGIISTIGGKKIGGHFPFFWRHNEFGPVKIQIMNFK